MTVLNLFKILLAFATAALIVGTGTVAGLFWHFSHGLPDHKQLADYQPATVSRLYAADGRLLAEYAHEKRVFVPVAAMPKRVLRGLRRGRGPALLHPSRHRLHRRDARRDRQRRQPRQAAGGRLGHHPAGRQELPADQPGDAGAQDPRGHPRLPHRGDLLQGAHPRALSQRDLSRLGQLRRGPGGASTISTARSTSSRCRRSPISRRCPRRPTATTSCATRRRPTPGATTCWTACWRTATSPRPRCSRPRPRSCSCAAAAPPRS